MTKMMLIVLVALTGHRAAYGLLAAATLAGCLGLPKDMKDWAVFGCYLLLVLRR